MTDPRVITWWRYQRQLVDAIKNMNAIEKELLAQGWRYNHLTDTWEQGENQWHTLISAKAN